MAVNRTKVLEAAQKFLSKGQYDKAIAEYQKLVVEDPRDVRTLLKIGDLHTKRNKPKDAIDVYQKVAELYAKQGFFLKAVAVYKQILKLDPTHIDSSQKLAKMYEELALTSDALNTYEQVADAYLAQGQTQKALETMERMVELDGQNVAVRIKYAEALSKADKTKEAAKAFAEGAALLKEQGRMDDYIRVVERQLYHDAENLDLARTLSSLYLERQDPKRALAKLQICFKADPRDVQTLEMLAEAFRQLGQIPKTISVLKEISRLHAEFGATEARRRTLKRVLDLDPNDAEARQGLGAAVAAPAQAPTQAQRTGFQAAQPQPAAQVARATSAEAQVPRSTSADQLPRSTSAGTPNAQAARPAAAGQMPRTTSAAQPERNAPVPTEPLRTMKGLAPAPQAPVAKTTRAPSSFPPVPDADEVELSVEDSSEFDLLDSSDDANLDSDLLSDDADNEEVLIVDDRTDRHAVSEPPPSKGAIATSRQLESKQDRIARLLSDADAHEGYGLYDKVETLLKEVLTIETEHLPTHERLKDLYIATDRRVDAARELLWLSDVWNDRNRDRAIQYAREAYDLAPNAAATKNRLAALGVKPGDEPPEDVMFVEDSKVAALPPPPASLTHDDERDEPAPPLRARDASAFDDIQDEDPLDIPISPDEFDAPPPMQARGVRTESYADLLDEEVSPEDFDREGPATATHGVLDQASDDEMADLLDAPISPDEFDAPPPRRSMVGPSDVSDLLNKPQPEDDFGLSDERFDRSGLIDADSTEIGDALEIRAAVAKSFAQTAPNVAQVPDDDNEPSVEFVEVGTGEIDVAEIEAAEAASSGSGTGDAFAPLNTSELEFDRDEADARDPADATPIPGQRKVSLADLPPLPPFSPAKAPSPMAPLPAFGRPAQPAFAKATLPEPVAAKPAAAKPAAPKPAVPEPAFAKPAFAKPAFAKPAFAKPAFASPAPETRSEPDTAQDADISFAEVGAAVDAVSRSPYGAPPPPAQSVAKVAPDSGAEPLDDERPASDLTPEIEETLDEADFFASQGMMDEASELIQEAILIHPGNKALKAKMLEYEAAADAQEAREEAEVEAKKLHDDSFDIAEQLADTTGGPGAEGAADEMIDVESVFAQFKKGVSEQIGIDDSETHFDLGIAYREMGLINDAVQEFEIASRGEKRACAALTMIGTCALEQGDAQRAVDQFNRALATKHKSVGEELALQYEIGNAYEQLGQVDRAIKAFEAAASKDRTFRGVVQRIDLLKKKRGPMASDDADVDAALDELLGGE